MKVKFKKLLPSAKAPFKQHEHDAGWDLTVASISFKNGLIVYSSDIAVEIPTGYVGLLFSRSSVANKDLILSNCVGVIDSTYRGPIMAKFRKTKQGAAIYDIGERFCQLIIIPHPTIQWQQVDELSETARANSGYGSTNNGASKTLTDAQSFLHAHTLSYMDVRKWEMEGSDFTLLETLIKSRL